MDLDEIRKSILGQVQKVGQGFVNQIGQPRKAQGIGTTTPNLQRVTNVYNALPRPVQNVSRQVVNTIAKQPLIQSPSPIGIPTRATFSPTVGQYAQGQYATQAQKVLDPKSSALDKIASLAQIGFSTTPAGLIWNVAGGGSAGALRSIRTGQSFNKSISEGIANPTSLGGEGFGLPTIPALAVDIAAGSPKGVVKGIKNSKQIINALRSSRVQLPAYTKDAVEQIMEPKNRRSVINTLSQFDNIFGSNMPKAGIPSIKESNIVRSNLEFHYKQLYGANAKLPTSVYELRDAVANGFKELSGIGRQGLTFANFIDQSKQLPLKERNILGQGEGARSYASHRTSPIRGRIPLISQNNTLSLIGEKLENPFMNFLSSKGKNVPKSTQQVLQEGDQILEGGQGAQQGLTGQGLKLKTSQSILNETANPLKIPLSGSISQEGLRHTLPGSYTNVRGIDNRLYKGGVVDEIQKGFEAGRKAQSKSKGPVGQQLRTEFIDRLTPIHDFVKMAGKDLPAEQNPYKKMRLLAGVSGKVETFVDRNITPVLRKEQKRLSDLSTLLVLDRERELIGRGLQRKRTLNQLDEGLAELEAKYGPEGLKTLQESANQIRQVGTSLMDELKNAGIISDESYQAIRSRNEFYAPFEAVEHMADALEKGHGTGSFNVSSQDVIKQIGDYQGDVADPLEGFLKKVPKVIGLVEKNKAIKSLVDLRNQFPEIYGDIIRPIKGNVDNKSAVSLFENGKNVKYEVPEMVESAVKNLDAESANLLVSLGKWQANALRTGATALNVGFIPVNIARDIQDSLVTELSEKGAGAMLKFLGSYPRAIFSAAKRDDLYKEWLSSGGAQSTVLEQILKNTPKGVKELSGQLSLIRTAINSPRASIEFLNRVAEQSTRIARFSAGRARGESLEEAAFKSRDISLDFAKSGNSIKVLNQVVPFLNAGIQGTEKMMRLYKTNPTAAVGYTLLLYGLPSIMLYRHNSQFEDYADIPESEKQNNWIFIARDRTPEEIQNNDKIVGVKIPKGFLGRVVANYTDASIDFLEKRDPQSFLNMTLDTVEAVSPVGLPYDEASRGRTLSRILPPVLKAGVEDITNTNLYFGNKIVPQSLEDLPKSEQYRENTPGVYKVAGKLANVSPLKLENTVNSTTGGLGRQLATAFSGDLKGGTVDQVTRRFSGIQGGVKANEAYDLVEKEKEYTALRNKQLKEAFRDGDMAEFERLSQGMSAQQIKSLITNDFKKEAKQSLTPEQRAYQSLTKEEQRRILQDRPELKSDLEAIPQADASEGDFKANLKKSAEESIIKTRVELSGEPEKVNNKYYFRDDSGSVKTLDLNPPTKGTGIGSFVNKDWKAEKAVKVWNNQNIPKDIKEEAYKELGVDPKDVRYAALASYGSDISAQYIASKSPDHETLLKNILSGRVEGITGAQFADNGVIDQLVDMGELSKEEASYLKKVKFVKENGQLVQKLTGRVGKGRKIPLSALKKPTGRRISVKNYSTPKIKLADAPKLLIPNVSFNTQFTPGGNIPQAPNFKTRIKFNL